MRKRLYAVAAAVTVLGLAAAGFAATNLRPQPAKADASGTPRLRYQHVFYIMMENQAYDEIMSPKVTDAPYIQGLAKEYGLATNYYGVTHDSEPNYVAAVGGSYFAVTNTSSPLNTDDSSDNAYYCSPTNTAPECAGTTGDHQIDAPSLFSQLEGAGLSWKDYQQSMPSVGYQRLNNPPAIPGQKLYAAKHNPLLNFLAYYGPAPRSVNFTPTAAQQAELNKSVPLDDANVGLWHDLQMGTTPNFSFIVPDQCHDMHGTAGCSPDLIQEGNDYVKTLVTAIQSSSVWQNGNTAIVITWDENDYSNLDCNTSVTVASNGCQVPTIVVTNHGPRGVIADYPANHYSLLLSIEQAFGLGCLQNSCVVRPLNKLFATSH
jgi:hypothetical protein